MDRVAEPIHSEPEAETTVGLLGDPMIHAWAGAADVAQPLALLTSALGIRSEMQAVLFRGVLDALGQIAPILGSWDLNGSQTYGTARLAAAWQRRPLYLDVVLPPKVDVGASSDKDFETDIDEGLISKEHDALFLLLGRPYPHGVAEAVHRRLRAWALLHGLRLFALAPGPDRLLSRVSRSLANAALETEDTAWRDLLAKIGGPADRWEQINSRLIALSDDKRQEKLPRHRDFLAASYKLAKLGSDPHPGSWIKPPGLGIAIAWAHLLESTPSAGGLEEEEFEPTVRAVPRTGRAADADHDSAGDLDSFETDPGQTTDEQAQAVQIIRFQLGAAARFLPWDWPQLIPPEREALATLISHTFEAPTHAAELCLAAIMSVAVATGKTLDEVAAVPLQAPPVGGFDWWLDLGSGSLVRLPPRHATHWKPTLKTTPHVRAAVQELHFPIAKGAILAIRAARRARPSANMLGQLWSDPTSLRAAFRSWVNQGRATSRIQPSMVAKLLGQTTFERCDDAVLARLISSNRVAPMPSSTVYTAYGLDQLMAAIPGMTAIPLISGPTPLNAAGSLLESADSDLVESSFTELLEEIRRHRRMGDVIRFHNATVVYWDAVLRAATGVRPVSDLWRSPAQFDWDNSAVYVDDKASPVARTGRMVPLPVKLCADFKALYLARHLPWVVGQLGTMFSVEPASIPALLFLVEEGSGPPDLVAIENRHRRTRDGNNIEGCLPLNLFRHRLRTLLHRERDVDLEVVDTVLGHGDGGATLTHGDYSMRIWRLDAEAIRPALTRIFESLYVASPALWPGIDLTDPAEPSTLDGHRFIDRSATNDHKAAAHRASADTIIRRFMGMAGAVETGDAESLPALVASLTEDQLDDLSCRLLEDEQGMPSATGALRYDRLLELAATAWDQLGLRAPFRRRYSPRDIEPSPFTPLAPQAGALMSLLRLRLDAMFEDAGERSRIKLKHAMVLVIFDLALTSRITNPVLLSSVAENDRPWRVVRFKDDFFLEWSPSDDLELTPAAPIQRYAISLRSAWLLVHSVRGKARRKAAWQGGQLHALPLSFACAPVFGADQVARLDDLLTAVLSTVDQANTLDLPGSVAGFLAGRVWTASLGWADWIRLRTGRWVDTGLPGRGDARTEDADPKQTLRIQQLPEDDDSDFATVAETCFQDADETRPQRALQSVSLQDAAFALIRRVQMQLRKLSGPEDGSKHRARAAESLSREIQASAASVSSAVQLMCLWSIDMLLRPGRSRKLATNSVLRYVGALSKRFKAMAYAVDLETMDDVEIEEFYSFVLTGATVANVVDTYDGLRNFHKFSQVACGLPDIDWTLLTVSRQVRLGSPGFVDEPTYLQLLASLSAARGSKNVAGWQLQCIALFAFRFGLRGGETTGLRRSDLHLDEPTPYLIVGNNRERRLKNRASRRVVPLLFDLTPVELSAIRKLNDFHAVDGVALENAPAFATVDDPSKALDGRSMCAVINSHLKAITGQTSSTVHKLRKAFLIRVWRAVEAPDFQATGLPPETSAARERIRGTLLGPCKDRVSRRGAWAVARSGGHSSISSTMRSYINILSDVAHNSVAIPTLPASLGLRPEMIDAPALHLLFPEMVPIDRGGHFAEPRARPVDALRALMFLSRGRSASEAAEFSDMVIARVEDLQAVAASIHARFLGDPPGGLRRHVDNPRSRRLARLGILSLLHINAHARLRKGLTTLPPSLLEHLSTMEPIGASEWEAIIGSRREISMWKPAHFALTAVVVRHFLESKDRPKLLAPISMTSASSRQRLTRMAISASWLPDESGSRSAEGDIPLCFEIADAHGLPRVRVRDEGHTVDARLVLRLTGVNASDNICDGFELAVALACLNALSSPGSP